MHQLAEKVDVSIYMSKLTCDRLDIFGSKSNVKLLESELNKLFKSYDAGQIQIL